MKNLYNLYEKQKRERGFNLRMSLAKKALEEKQGSCLKTTYLFNIYYSLEAYQRLTLKQDCLQEARDFRTMLIKLNMLFCEYDTETGTFNDWYSPEHQAKEEAERYYYGLTSRDFNHIRNNLAEYRKEEEEWPKILETL